MARGVLRIDFGEYFSIPNKKTSETLENDNIVMLRIYMYNEQNNLYRGVKNQVHVNITFMAIA